MALTPSQAAKDAERLLRRVWQRGADSVPLPVDPVRIARRLGIDVYEADLPHKVSAALVKESGQDPAIVLSKQDSPNRKRFSCAHELGHFVTHADAPDEYEYIDYRDPLSGTGRNPDEVYANHFAASLLMPAEEVRARHSKGLSAIELSWEFDVSAEAMQYRLANLRLK